MTKPPPGQLGMFGGETPPEKPEGRLTAVGFAPVMQDGQTRYRDPYSSGPLLTRAAALVLLRERMRNVISGGWRVHYPAGRLTASRIGHRRATLEGARHEIRGFTGGHPHPDVYILDADGKRVP